MLTVDLPPEIERHLDALAARSGRTRDAYVRDAILEHVQDRVDAEEAEARLAALKRGESGTLPLSDLIDRYGLAD
ncbi:type II toxin-antitoxin system RelB family antitoxin [Methylobacterium sp. A54F]